MLKNPNKIGLKLLSVILSCGIVMSCPVSYAGYPEAVSVLGREVNKKTLKKVLIGAVVVTIGGVCCKYLVDTAKSNAVKGSLDQQIKIFINRAPDVFQVEDELVKNADHEVLLENMCRLNELCDKYKVFVDKLIEIRREGNEKFILGVIKGDDAADPLTIARTNFRRIELNVSEYSGYQKGFHAPCRPSDHKVQTITHEFGHVIEKIIVHMVFDRDFKMQKELEVKCIELNGKYDAEIARVLESRDPELVEKALRTSDEYKKAVELYANAVNQAKAKDPSQIVESMKDEIIRIAREKYGCGDTRISRYGEESAGEWFAEVFAHMECSDSPNALGRAMGDYLAEQAMLIK